MKSRSLQFNKNTRVKDSADFNPFQQSVAQPNDMTKNESALSRLCRVNDSKISLIKKNSVIFVFLKTMKKIPFVVLMLFLLTLTGCNIYNFTGAKVDAKTFQVNFFQNNADLVEPGIDRKFTQKLQNLIQDQTNLSLTNAGGELVFEGEISDYRISPMTATADQKAAQNRLTITVNVRFTNKKKEADDFENKKFTFFKDYPGNEQLVGGALTAALDEIFEHITQDIFNASLAKW